MKTKKKALLTVLCAVMLVVGSVFGTYAYLTDKTDPVTNTFTIGNIGITLDETKVDEKGVVTNPVTRTNSNSYKLLPAVTYVKDPTVHVQPGSEKCYVFVEVTNGISTYESTHVAADTSKGIKEYKTIAEQITAKGWTSVAGKTGVYYKTVESSGTAQDLVVFNEFRIADNANTLNGWANIGSNNNIVVTAYAIQFAGFESDVAGAWTAVKTAYSAA